MISFHKTSVHLSVEERLETTICLAHELGRDYKRREVNPGCMVKTSASKALDIVKFRFLAHNFEAIGCTVDSQNESLPAYPAPIS